MNHKLGSKKGQERMRNGANQQAPANRQPFSAAAVVISILKGLQRAPYGIAH